MIAFSLIKIGTKNKIFFCGVSPPHDETLLIRQKCPKPFPSVRGPAGDFATKPNYMAAQLAPLKQCSPEEPNLVPRQSRAQGETLN